MNHIILVELQLIHQKPRYEIIPRYFGLLLQQTIFVKFSPKLLCQRLNHCMIDFMIDRSNQLHQLISWRIIIAVTFKRSVHFYQQSAICLFWKYKVSLRSQMFIITIIIFIPITPITQHPVRDRLAENQPTTGLISLNENEII